MTKIAPRCSLWGKTQGAHRRLDRGLDAAWTMRGCQGMSAGGLQCGSSWEPLYWATEKKLKELEVLPSLLAKWEIAVENLSLLPHKEGGFSQFTHLTRNEWSRKIFMETIRRNFKGKGHNHQCHWQEGRRWNRNSSFGESWELCTVLVDDQHILSLYCCVLQIRYLPWPLYWGSHFKASIQTVVGK